MLQILYNFEGFLAYKIVIKRPSEGRFSQMEIYALFFVKFCRDKRLCTFSTVVNDCSKCPWTNKQTEKGFAAYCLLHNTMHACTHAHTCTHTRMRKCIYAYVH